MQTSQRDERAVDAPAAPAWWPARPKLTWMVAGVVVALVVATITITTLVRQGPDDVVREYLAAIQRRDVDKALAIAGVTHRPAGEAARFLDGKVLSRDWKIVELTTTADAERDDGTGWAQVKVTIAGPDGAQDGGFDLTKKPGNRWRLDEPFLAVTFAPTPVRYLDVNGVVVPGDRAAGSRYLMLPGFYRFFATRSELVDVVPVSALLLQRWNLAEGGVFRPVSVTLTKKGEESLTRSAKAVIDSCAKRLELELEGCPFGAGRGDYVEALDGGGFSNVTNARWRVLRYPVMAFSDRGSGFAISLVAPGAVELSATGTREAGAPGKRVPFTTQCQIGRPYWGFVATLTAPGAFAVGTSGPALGTCG